MKEGFLPNIVIAGFLAITASSAIQAMEKEGSTDAQLASQSDFDVLSAYVCENDLAGIDQYLVAGGNINAQNKKGQTVLMKASLAALPIMIWCLLNKGANPDIQDNHQKTALIYIVCERSIIRHDLLEKANELIQCGASLDLRDSLGMTALVHALSRKDEDMVALLLTAGASCIDIADNDGLTPLMWAAIKSLPTSMQALLLHGANPNALDNNKWSALMLVLRSGTKETMHEMAQLLLSGGADPNLASTDGTTALWLAENPDKIPRGTIKVQCGGLFIPKEEEGAIGDFPAYDMIKLLLDHGAKHRWVDMCQVF